MGKKLLEKRETYAYECDWCMNNTISNQSDPPRGWIHIVIPDIWIEQRIGLIIRPEGPWRQMHFDLLACSEECINGVISGVALRIREVLDHGFEGVSDETHVSKV